MREVDDFFEREKHFLVEYHAQLRDCTVKADKMSVLHRSLADSYIKISQGLSDLSRLDSESSAAAAANGEAPSAHSQQLEPFLGRAADALEKMRRIEGRVASDQDLKLSDTLRYHGRDASAAKDLLYRRLRCLANYESANKALDRARTRNRDVPQVRGRRPYTYPTNVAGVNLATGCSLRGFFFFCCSNTCPWRANAILSDVLVI